MRVLIAGVAHWHTRHFVRALQAQDDVHIVAVSDADEAATRDWAEELGVPAFSDCESACDSVDPELAVVLGRPVDMAPTGRFLIDAGIPTLLEKPCGVNIAEIAELAQLARDRGAFVAVPFSYRWSRMVQLIREFSGDAHLEYATFKVISGVAERYRRWHSAWNLDPALAGGGSTLNIGIHFFDLLRVLAPAEPWTVTGASMSSRISKASVEDFSTVLLGSGSRRATVETGYFYPVKLTSVATPGNDLAFSLAVGDQYYTVRSPDVLTVRLADATDEVYHAGTTQASYYADFMRDSIDRIGAGQAPACDLDDMLAAGEMAKDAYRLAGFDRCMQ